MCWDIITPGVPVSPSIPPYLTYEVALTYFEGTLKEKGLRGCTSCLWASLVFRGQKRSSLPTWG